MYTLHTGLFELLCHRGHAKVHSPELAGGVIGLVNVEREAARQERAASWRAILVDVVVVQDDSLPSKLPRRRGHICLVSARQTGGARARCQTIFAAGRQHSDPQTCLSKDRLTCTKFGVFASGLVYPTS